MIRRYNYLLFDYLEHLTAHWAQFIKKHKKNKKQKTKKQKQKQKNRGCRCVFSSTGSKVREALCSVYSLPVKCIFIQKSLLSNV
jgi:hypothetical protein